MFEVLVARERASSSRTSHVPPRRSQARQQSSALLTKAQEAGSGPICCYCQQPHTSADSITVSNITVRKQILRSSSCCFNGLREGHQAGARSAVDVITPPYVRKPLNRLKGHPGQPSHNQGWIQLPPNTSRFRLRTLPHSVQTRGKLCYYRQPVQSYTISRSRAPQSKFDCPSTVAVRDRISWSKLRNCYGWSQLASSYSRLPRLDRARDREWYVRL